METYLYLRYVLLVIIGAAVMYLLLQSRTKRRTSELQERPFEEIYVGEDHAKPILSQDSLRVTNTVETSLQSNVDSSLFLKMLPENLLTIYVFAKSNNRFSSYDLLQAISSTGMQFGDMNIFHYYQRSPQGKKIILFSLASATKPGEFDLDRMGIFSCIGLTLFMDITQVPNPLQAFYLMMGAAEHLADDLEGELRASPKILWNDSYFKAYEQKIMHLQPEKVL